jgi:hypothetical protein
MNGLNEHKLKKSLNVHTLIGAIACSACLAGIVYPGAGNINLSAQVQPSQQERREFPAELAPQFADRDILGELELGKDEDPSFESVSSHLPAMKRPREVVGVKHHPHDIGVAPDASLELSDDVDAPGSPVAFFEVGNPAVRFGATPAGCSKSLLDGLPVVVASFDYRGVRYRQTVFCHSEGLSPDAELWAYVELQSESTDPAARRSRVSFRVVPESAVKAAKGWELKLSPGIPVKIYLKVPFDIRNQGWLQIDGPEFERRKAEVLDFWKNDLSRGTQLRSPEKRVNEALGAWLAFASLDVDKRNGVLEPHDGAGFYEQVYGYSAALYPHALDLWGRHEEARKILESLLTFQTPDGLFYQNFGTPDPGTLLFALSEHFVLTADAEWLKRVAPRMIKMADWISSKRRESITPPGQPRSVTYGLIKFRPYCDHHDPAFDYFGDTYCAVGLEKTARVLAAVGFKKESRRIASEAAAYRKDILASMDAAVLDRGGMKILPMEPDTQRLLKGSNGRAGGYYGLIASCMLESEFLPEADDRASWVMRFMEQKGGLRLGLSEFAGGIDHAYTYGYWLDCLKLGRVRPVMLGFYGSLAYGMSRETYSGVEVTKLFTGDNDPTLPHLYSCTQQLRLLRMMLVREDGDRLWIGQAVPRHWMADGNTLEVKEAATAFGPVSLSIRPHPGRGRIEIEWTAPERRTPKAVLLRLREPSGRKIKSVKVNGRPVRSFTHDTVEIKSPRGVLAVEVAY